MKRQHNNKNNNNTNIGRTLSASKLNLRLRIQPRSAEYIHITYIVQPTPSHVLALRR